VDTLPLSIANGWASGISAYATVLTRIKRGLAHLRDRRSRFT
jgi:hypothetical protein